MITGWLTRLVVVFAVIAVVLFDAGSAIVNFFSLDSKAEEIAVSLATAITNHELPTDNPQILKDRAKDLAEEAGAHLVRAEMGADGVILAAAGEP